MIRRKILKSKTIGLVVAATFMLSSFAGCGTKNKVEDENDKKEEVTVAETTEATTEVTEVVATENTAEERTVNYGDTIRVSEVMKVKGALSEAKGVDVYEEEKGESVFVVAKETEEFDLSDTGLTEEEIMENVNKAVGKKVGETFTLSNEFGDGTYSFEYTILEIMSPEDSDGNTGAETNPEWKAVYKKFLTGISRNFTFTEELCGADYKADYVSFALPNTYYLIYVDDDDVPELVVNYFVELGTWYEYLYCIDGDSVKRVDYDDKDRLTDGWRSHFMFKEKTGEFAIEDGTGDMHYWDNYSIYDYNKGEKLHEIGVEYQTKLNYTVDGEEVSEEEAKETALQYFDKFDCVVDEGLDVYGYETINGKKVSWDNVIHDFGEVEITFDSDEYQQSSIGSSFTVPENFYDYSFATNEIANRYEYWNQGYGMNIEYYEFTPDGNYSLTTAYEDYKARDGYTVDYEFIDDKTMVVSGTKPDGNTIYYTKESLNGSNIIKIVFEYPKLHEKECGDILEKFLGNVQL